MLVSAGVGEEPAVKCLARLANTPLWAQLGWQEHPSQTYQAGPAQCETHSLAACLLLSHLSVLPHALARLLPCPVAHKPAYSQKWQTQLVSQIYACRKIRKGPP